MTTRPELMFAFVSAIASSISMLLLLGEGGPTAQAMGGGVPPHNASMFELGGISATGRRWAQSRAVSPAILPAALPPAHCASGPTIQRPPPRSRLPARWRGTRWLAMVARDQFEGPLRPLGPVQGLERHITTALKRYVFQPCVFDHK